MQKSLNTSKWYNNAWAALIYFTRLPLWRMYQPPKSAYRAVVEFWPLAGWLTGTAMAATLYFGTMAMPHALAVALAIVVRLLLTGAFHEDGLADFIDGFGGGGSDRQRVLDIMKDSHIGTYGVLGLIIYYLLMVSAGSAIAPEQLCLLALCGDCWSKCCAAQIINMLPYARSQEEAKNKTIYSRMTAWEWIICLAFGVLPAVVIILILGLLPTIYLAAFAAPAVAVLLIAWMCKRRIGGYTGDCCGAAFILCELAFYLTIAIAFPAVG